MANTFPVRNLTTVDVSKSWMNTDTDLFTEIPKPITSSSNSPTFLNEGSSWSDGTNIYFYGGLISYCSGCNGPDSVPPIETWQYNIAGNKWSNDVFGGTPLQVRLSEGVAVQSTITNKAYYIGGIVISEGNPTMHGSTDFNCAVSSFLTLDLETKDYTNKTLSGLNAWNTIGAAFTTVIDKVGEQGIIITFGGYTYPHGQLMRRLASNQSEAHQNSMEDISIYDIANDEWYTQRSSGDIPTWRMAGCSVAVAAPDNSSFSIYVFGGMGDTVDNSDGNVYVLSLPSFSWIRVYENATPRMKHVCRLLGKHTMLVVGGNVPTKTGGEFYPESGNCDSSGTFANGLGIFDLLSHSWRSDYDATDQGNYTVSSDISSVIGGSETGGATETQPANGFNSSGLASLFQYSSNSTSPSSPSSSSTGSQSPNKSDSLSGGAIAGIVIGVVAAVVIFATALVMLRKKRKRQFSGEVHREEADSTEVKQTGPSQLHGQHLPHELDNAKSVVELPTEVDRVNELEGEGTLR